jgi:hypothetical protein
MQPNVADSSNNHAYVAFVIDIVKAIAIHSDSDGGRSNAAAELRELWVVQRLFQTVLFYSGSAWNRPIVSFASKRGSIHAR